MKSQNALESWLHTAKLRKLTKRTKTCYFWENTNCKMHWCTSLYTMAKRRLRADIWLKHKFYSEVITVIFFVMVVVDIQNIMKRKKVWVKLNMKIPCYPSRSKRQKRFGKEIGKFEDKFYQPFSAVFKRVTGKLDFQQWLGN